MAKQSQNELRDDIKHIVNVLICSARDGEYATEKHMDLYRKFCRMVGCSCGRRLGYVVPPPELDWSKLI